VSLKDRLANRKRPSTTYSLRIDDDTAARAELAAAQAAGDDARVAAAQAVVDACYEQVTITAVAPKTMEELRAAHPPTDIQRDRDKKAEWDPATFVPALLAACVDSDITEAEWAEYTTTGSLNSGEVNSLFNAAWEINYRVPDINLKKG